MSSIAENIKQKRKSPFYGAFVFSWIAINWKPVSIFLFSDSDIYFKIKDIEKYTSFSDQVVNPILMTTFIILAVPLFHAIYKYYDVTVGVIHDTGDSVKEIFINIINSRKERARIIREKNSELVAAQQQQLIEESKRIAAEDKIRTALSEAELFEMEMARKSIRKLNDETKALKQELENNKKSSQVQDDLYNQLKNNLEGLQSENARLVGDVLKLEAQSLKNSDFKMKTKDRSLLIQAKLEELFDLDNVNDGTALIPVGEHKAHAIKKEIKNILSEKY